MVTILNQVEACASRARASLLCAMVVVVVGEGLYLGHILDLIHVSVGERSRAAQADPSLYNTGIQKADDSFISSPMNDNTAGCAPMHYLCISRLFGGICTDLVVLLGVFVCLFVYFFVLLSLTCCFCCSHTSKSLSVFQICSD